MTKKTNAPVLDKEFNSFKGRTFSGATAWLDSLQVKTIKAFSWHCPQQWCLEQRSLPNPHMWYIEKGKGKGWYGTPEQIFSFKDNDLLFFPAHVDHTLHSPEAMRVHTIHFSATVLSGIDLLWFIGLQGQISSPNMLDLHHLVISLSREYHFRLPGWRVSMSAEIVRLLLAVIDSLPAESAPNFPEGITRICPALQLIDSYLDDPTLSIAELAAEIHVSENYFRILFTKAMGMKPLEFLRQKRINMACTLLQTTTYSVKEIAARSGYQNRQVFHTAFRQLTGTTPVQYRKTQANQQL